MKDRTVTLLLALLITVATVGYCADQAVSAPGTMPTSATP